MIYRFLDDKGTFQVEDPSSFDFYLPLTDAKGDLLSCISPNLSGDIKRDNDHFLTPPASILDLKNNPLCCREFFIEADGRIVRLSRPFRDSLEAGLLYHKITKKTEGLHIEVTNFIPHDIAAEVMWIKIKNSSNRKKLIVPTSFIPLFGRSEKNLRDHRHVSSLLNRLDIDRYSLILRPTMIFDEKGHKKNDVNYFSIGFEGDRIAPQGQFPTIEYFLGKGDIMNPDGLLGKVAAVNKKETCFDGKEACAAFRFREKNLRPGQEADYFIILGITEDKRKIKEIFSRLDCRLKVIKSLDSTKKYWQQYLSSTEFDFKDKNYNNWLIWLKLQPTLRRLFGCSFLPHFDYGKGGRGWRDLWQDALSLLMTEPEKAEKIIFGSFAGVRLDGSNATIITSQGDFIADRNKINRVWMDHGVWPYLTTRLYLNRTKDFGFLLKEQTYFRDHSIDRARKIDQGFSQRDFLQRTRRARVYKGTILEHILIQNLAQFFNVGRHNIIRLENADWNDGLDMAADQGESVAFSFMYCHNLSDICEFLQELRKKQRTVSLLKEMTLLLDSLNKKIDYDDYRQKQKRLKAYFNSVFDLSGEKLELSIDDLIADLKRKYDHMSSWLRAKEWLSQGFFNGYYDNKGKKVEGRRGSKTVMMLASCVFSVMSEIASNDQVAKICSRVKRYLWDKKVRGFRLNTDMGTIYMDLGRAFGFSYGDKENGAFFNHMNVMFANSLYKRRFVQEGHSVLDSIYRMCTDDKAKIPPVLPEYFNSSGKGLYLYLTGSASWYVYTLVEEVLGIKFHFGDLCIDPGLVAEDFYKDSIEVRLKFAGKQLLITYHKKNGCKGPCRIKSVSLGNKEITRQAHGFIIARGLLKNRINNIKVCF